MKEPGTHGHGPLQILQYAEVRSAMTNIQPEPDGSAQCADLLATPNGGPKRTVLILGGGGMRGMAHVGVLRALKTLGIRYDIVIGTSIGSLIGAAAAAGLSVEEIEDKVASLQKEDYFRLNFVKLLMKGARAPSMYQGDRFRERVQDTLPVDSFAELRLPFFCNAVRLETGGSVFFGTPGFQDVSLSDAVYASCALPGVFEPLEHDGFNYMDGGIVDAVPLRFAKTLQPDLIIAVDLTVKATFKTPNYKRRVLSTLYRSFEIVEEVLVEHSLHMQVDYKTVMIQPKVGHLARLDFEGLPEVVRRGEEEALRVLTSHAATRDLVGEKIVDGLCCPVNPRDYVSVRVDPSRCIGCGMCEMICETDAFWARGETATVRKLSNYECTRDHACARNCPTDAISLGNL
ncbi:MAG: patatin-like phospholipase family protein [Planctomycetota bacterium]|jgi:NTE family protein|nr:patatin-like phospholipase family protein [Planctomycetota bacterium]